MPSIERPASQRDLATLYERYWEERARTKCPSLEDENARADTILGICGGGRILDVGSGRGGLVQRLLASGVDAQGIDIAASVVDDASARLGDRVAVGSALALGADDESFDCITSIDVLHRLTEREIDQALAEALRVTRRSIFVELRQRADEAEFSETEQLRSWWEERFIAAGFRKHPAHLDLTPYEALENEHFGTHLRMVFEKVPAAARTTPRDAGARTARETSIDALCTVGREAEARTARYWKAAVFVRPGDVVLDLDCGFGCGAAVLAAKSQASTILGLDRSATTIARALAAYATRDPRLEFRHVGDGNLESVPDCSVDYVTAFALFDGVTPPERQLEELHRVLKPSGRIVVRADIGLSAPETRDRSDGADPPLQLLEILERRFVIEAVFAQSTGSADAVPPRPRDWHELPASGASRSSADCLIAMAMKSPFDQHGARYVETSFASSAEPLPNIVNFAHEYENPWLIKGIVAIGMRQTNTAARRRLASQASRLAPEGSVDAGAALCVQAYDVLTNAGSSVTEIRPVLEQIDDHLARATGTPHGVRWSLSLRYVAASLRLLTGERDAARSDLEACVAMDVLAFSPLLATKTVDARFRLGCIAAFDGDLDRARRHWTLGLEEARRVLSGSDWREVWGRSDNPIAFGIPELTAILDTATLCSYALTQEDRWLTQPGLAWTATQQNFTARAVQAARKMRLDSRWIDALESSLKTHQSARETQSEERLLELTSQAEELRHELAEQTARLASAWRDLERERAITSDLRHGAADLRTELNDLRQHSTRLQRELDTMRGSTTARVLEGINRARFAVAPRGGKIERGAWLTKRAVSKMREGPRAWMAAARRELAVRRARRHDNDSTASLAVASHEITPTAHADLVAVPGRVSVILPVYQQADLLPSSIDSVLAQTYTDFELIVLNDGSSDAIAAVAERYREEPRVRMLTQSNQKLPKALSNAFDFATGEFWTWTSADNLMEPTQLEKLVARLRADPGIAMVYADYYAIDDRGAMLTDPNFRPHNRHEPTSPAIHLPRSPAQLNTVQDNFIGACFMYRGWVGRLIGEYDPQLGVEDYDYWMRINGLFRIEHLGSDELLYRYRVHDNSLNARAAELNILEKVQSLMEYEVERAAAYARPLTVFADGALLSVLRSVDATIEPLPTELPDPLSAQLVIVRPEVGRAIPSAGHRTVAVVFDPGPDTAYAWRDVAARPDAVCFAADRATCAVLKIFNPATFSTRDAATVLGLASAFTRNRQFYRSTRSADLTARSPAQMWPRGALHVLFQVDDFVQGGLEQVVLDTAEVLEAHDVRSSLLVLGEQGRCAERAREAGIEVLTLPAVDRDAAYRRLLRDRGVDVVNAHHSLFGADVCAALAIPFVQVVHNTYVWLGPEQIAAYRAADSATTAYACVSHNVAQYADLRIGLTTDKLVVLNNGVDSERSTETVKKNERVRIRDEFGLRDDDFVFLNVASIYPPKAQRITVRAIAALRRTHPTAKVILLGRAMEQAYADLVRDEVRSMGLDDAVLFAGYREDVRSFYDAADAFLLPSYWEGWSLAVAEAGIAGLPAVLTDVGGAREQLQRVGGTLVEPPFTSITELDASSLQRYVGQVQDDFVERVAEGMRNVMDDREKHRPMAEAGIERFSRERAYGRYRRLFEALLNGFEPAALRRWLELDPD